tara:strand:+ start:616 stop:792 length:177 start_codon:yes stop_codon:yes gene_type:complete
VINYRYCEVLVFILKEKVFTTYRIKIEIKKSGIRLIKHYNFLLENRMATKEKLLFYNN